jgi:hypothetical protein
MPEVSNHYEMEAALAMRLADADPKALRRVLRRIEEPLDE